MWLDKNINRKKLLKKVFIFLLPIVIMTILLENNYSLVIQSSTMNIIDDINILYDFSDTKIVFRDDYGDLRLYDMKEDSNIKISSGGTNARIHGDNIVFIKDYQIMLYEISNEKNEILINSDKGTQWNPFIYNEIITWINDEENYGTIYYYNINSGKTRNIPSSRNVMNIDIYLDRIVWETSSSNAGEDKVYFYDIAREKTIEIPGSNNGEDPQIFLNRIIWKENSGTVWLYTFPTIESNIILTTIISLLLIEMILIINIIRWLIRKKKENERILIENLSGDNIEDKSIIEYITIQCPKCNNNFQADENKRSSYFACPYCRVNGKIS